jgi:hypothetical protein
MAVPSSIKRNLHSVKKSNVGGLAPPRLHHLQRRASIAASIYRSI